MTLSGRGDRAGLVREHEHSDRIIWCISDTADGHEGSRGVGPQHAFRPGLRHRYFVRHKSYYDVTHKWRTQF